MNSLSHIGLELRRVLQLSEQRETVLVAVGHGRSGAARLAAEAAAGARRRRCILRLGTTDTAEPRIDQELRSADLFVLGSPSRLIYHGIPKSCPACSTRRSTCDPAA
jgi:hypothetical protein